MSVRVTVYVKDENLLEWLDEKVEEGSFRSKSDAFERGLRYLKSKEPEPKPF